MNPLAPAPRADVVAMLEKLSYERARMLMPIVIAGVVIALVVSEPAGIPLPGSVLFVNAFVIMIALGLYLGLRERRLAGRWAHVAGSVVWLLAPIATIASYATTGAQTLALPMMIEIATCALQIDTRWTLLSTVPVVIAGGALAWGTSHIVMYPIGLVGLWIVAIIMQVALRRSIIRAETHRLDALRAAEVLARELEERRRAEADREKLRDQLVHAQRMDAVGTLAAGLAHDMNNILGGILAFAEVLHAEATAPETREDLARIRAEAERGAALTRSLLAFSRRGAYRRRPILLHSVLDDMSPLMSRTLGKHVKIERRDGAATTVEGDPAQLGQVVLNLCLNAADAMGGTGSLTIATDKVELAARAIGELPAGTYAKLAVSDTGTGMDAETKRRAFEPFFTTKPPGKGTGLGLAMVFGAVEAHGGAIDVITELGRGTTMTVYLPTTEASPALPAASMPAPARRTRGSVLIVDDEPVMRDAAARMIERLGLVARIASDGDEAIAIYRANADDIVLVLLDMVMPRMAGPECYRTLRAIGPTPVLLVSGFADDAAAQELLDSGADGFLEKPYTGDQLAAEIERILGKPAA